MSPALPHLLHEAGTPADAPRLGRGGLRSNQALAHCTDVAPPAGLFPHCGNKTLQFHVPD